MKGEYVCSKIHNMTNTIKTNDKTRTIKIFKKNICKQKKKEKLLKEGDEKATSIIIPI